MSHKVLVAADSLALGGAERQMALLLRYLPGTWSRCLWSLADGPFAKQIRNAGVEVIISPRLWRWDPLPALHLWKVIRSWHPSLVHTYGYMSTLAAAPACRSLGIPLVDGSIRQGCVPTYRGRITQWSCRWGDRVIANSEAGLRAFGISPKRGRVVYNAFDPERLPLCQRTTARSSVTFTAIMVARMHAHKDYCTFLDAARTLCSSDTSWRFWAAGKGPDGEKIRTQAHDLVPRGLVRLIGPCTEVLPHVRDADVGVLMTRQAVHAEGCSNAIMEYMACGLPVVCSDGGGNRELVSDGVTGLVVPPGNIMALVESLQWLRAHPVEAKLMGDRGRQRILEHFSLNRLIKNTLAVYEEVISTSTCSEDNRGE
jgi:glycosyltransferase involved in cell wall biosynthesis